MNGDPNKPKPGRRSAPKPGQPSQPQPQPPRVTCRPPDERLTKRSRASTATREVQAAALLRESLAAACSFIARPVVLPGRAVKLTKFYRDVTTRKARHADASNNPDDLLIVLFKNLALENEDKTKLAGRPIFDDVEQVEIRGPGSRNTHRATGERVVAALDRRPLHRPAAADHLRRAVPRGNTSSSRSTRRRPRRGTAAGACPVPDRGKAGRAARAQRLHGRGARRRRRPGAEEPRAWRARTQEQGRGVHRQRHEGRPRHAVAGAAGCAAGAGGSAGSRQRDAEGKIAPPPR